MNQTNGESRELFEWVKYSEEKPQSGNGRKQYLVRDIMHTQWLMYGITSKRWEDVFEWLKPIPQSSLKEEIFNEIPDIEPLIKKFLPNLFELSTFKPKEVLRLEAAFQQGAQVMFYQLKNTAESSLTPKSISDSDGWRSVEDELPQPGQMVDTWNGTANRRCKFEKPDLFIRHVEPFSNERNYVTHFPDITHWRPLPAPPNEKSASLKPNKITDSEIEKITRVEVIDKNGRSYTNWDDKNKVELSYQDNGKTLKIFIS